MFSTATWMANEFFRACGIDVGLSLTPGTQGRLEVYVDGEKIYDKLEEGSYPDLTRVRTMRKVIQAKLDEVLAPAD